MIEVIVGIITIIGGIVGVWLNLNLKVKQIEVQIVNIEGKFIELREERLETFRLFQKYNDQIWTKLDSIENKLDANLETVIKLKTEHELFSKCPVKPENKK